MLYQSYTRFKHYIIFSIFILLSSHSLHASNLASADASVLKSPPESWVIENTIPNVSDSRLSGASDGIFYKLIDNQVKWMPDGYAFYSRYVYRVTDRVGLENASKISQEFDPNDTEIAFNFIRITRDNQTTERLADTNITVLRQEDGLEQDIIDGNLTALIVIDDIREGDIIDYAVSGRVKYKLWPGEYFNKFSLGWSVPIGETRQRLIWPKDKPLYIKNFLTNASPKIEQQDEYSIYNWVANNPTPIPAEQGTPAWVYQWPTVALSSMQTWQEVQNWAYPYYKVDEALPEEFNQHITAIAKKWAEPRDRITEALRLVQNKIRYVGVEIGLGSHVPRAPTEVIKRGYGDCKDKAVLLVLVLNKLGIDAWPALVDTDIGPGLPNEISSPYAFNHVIVKSTVENETFWLDPTLSYQGGRGSNLEQPRYGFALPIDGKQNGLEEITPKAPEVPTLIVQEDFLLPNNGDSGLELTVTASYRGLDADRERVNVASQSIEDYQRSFLNFYNARFNGLTVKTPLSITDDLDQNILIISVAFALDKEQSESIDLRNKMALNAWAVRGLFYEPTQSTRQYELALPFLINRAHQINIELPGYRPSALKPFQSSIDGAKFERHFTADKHKLQIEFKVTTNKRYVISQKANEAIKFSKDINDKAYLNFAPNKVQESYANIFKIDEQTFAPYEPDLTQVFKLINDNKQLAALRIINKIEKEATDKNRFRGLIQTIRGEILNKLNRRSLAIQAYEEAIVLYSDEANTYFEMAEIYRTQELPEKEIDILIQLAKNIPERAKSLNNEWIMDLRRNLYSAGTETLFNPLALSLIRAGYKSDDAWGDDWMYLLAIDYLLLHNVENFADVKAEITEYLKIIKDPHSLLKIMVNRKYEPIWELIEDRTGKDLRLAIDNNLEQTKLAFEEDKTNYDKLNAYSYALRTAGQAELAIEVLQPYIDDWDSIVIEADDAFWVANNYADVLNETGRFDEAISVLARISELPISDFPSTVNMRINKTVMLQKQGKHKQALAYADTVDRNYASSYGNMFIDSARSCALFQLSRIDEANSILLEIEKMKNDNFAAYLGAVVCSKNEQKLLDIIKERLRDPSERADALLNFVNGKESKNISQYSQELERYIRRVLSKDSIRSVFNKYGREIEIDGYYRHWNY